MAICQRKSSMRARPGRHSAALALLLAVGVTLFSAGGAAAASYTYTGVWNGSLAGLTLVSNVTVESLPDATLVGTITDFQTADPSYSCLDGTAINVWTAPNEFPHELVVHDGDQGTQCAYGTWTIPQPYTGTWNGTLTTLTNVTNVTVEGLPDATLVGTIGNFQTKDPAFSCLDGESLNVWTAPKEYPNEYVVHNGDQGAQCTYGTWTFYTYTGTWKGSSTGLTHVAQTTVEGLPDATLVGTIGNFQTKDPAFSCLDGESLNVWTAPKEYPNEYVVHNGDQGTQCTYGNWTFPK